MRGRSCQTDRHTAAKHRSVRQLRQSSRSVSRARRPQPPAEHRIPARPPAAGKAPHPQSRRQAHSEARPAKSSGHARAPAFHPSRSAPSSRTAPPARSAASGRREPTQSSRRRSAKAAALQSSPGSRSRRCARVHSPAASADSEIQASDRRCLAYRPYASKPHIETSVIEMRSCSNRRHKTEPRRLHAVKRVARLSVQGISEGPLPQRQRQSRQPEIVPRAPEPCPKETSFCLETPALRPHKSYKEFP